MSGTDVGGVVQTSIVIEARPETVFGIVSDPAGVSRWLDGEASFEPRAGSAFKIAFPQFDTVIEGQVAEIEPHERVAFTWGVAEGPQAEWLPPGSTRVEISLTAEGAGTRVELRHSGLPTDAEVAQHDAGWRFHLSRLSLFANRDDLTEAMKRTADRWFAAWNEPDPDARGPLLEGCCAEAIAFADEYATLTGRELLSSHIGGYHRFMAGFSIEPDGDVRICRGSVLVPWRMLNEEGGVTGGGVNYAEVTPDGLFQRVVGFWGPGPLS